MCCNYARVSTNKAECNWLIQEKNLQKLAETEAHIIAEYYGLRNKPQTLYKVQVGAYSDEKMLRLYWKG